jgi:hypothetical protein
MPDNRNGPANGTVSDDRAGGSATSTLPQRGDRRPFHQRLQYARRISRELDWALGTCRYPDPAELVDAPAERQ